MDGNGGKVNMEKAKESLRLTEEDTEPVSRFAVPGHRAGDWSSFYEDFALRALEASESTESNPDSSSEQSRFLPASPAENANGAIADHVDVVGSYVDYVEGLSMNVSVDMSISYMSTAMLHVVCSKISRKDGWLVVWLKLGRGEVVQAELWRFYMASNYLTGTKASKMYW